MSGSDPSTGSAEVGSGKYAVLAPDARGHSSWFLTRTNREHQATMEHPWMKAIYAKTFNRSAYAQFLAGQYHMFRELEAHVEAHRQEWPLPAVHDRALDRRAALEADLRLWAGEGWERLVATPSPQTEAYVRQLRADASDPWLLLCHHFLQYNAALSGGQFLGRMVRERAQAEPDLAKVSEAAAAFYSFGPECQPPHARVQRYIEAVDALEISADGRERMLACMQRVYVSLLGQFDESFALAPHDGVSHGESKPQAASAGESQKEKGPKVPPPPMEPADRTFTSQELLAHSGQSPGVPILTSVLGRVYDVTAAKELFGPGGPYEMFAGHDGTYNLAVMSLKKLSLDRFEYELDAEDKECLADWIAYFDHRYQRPVGRLGGRQHSMSLQSLPRATKIPFSMDEDEDAEEAPSATGPAAAAPPASRL